MDNFLTDILDMQDKIWDIGCHAEMTENEFECLTIIKNELIRLYNLISNRQKEKIK